MEKLQDSLLFGLQCRPVIKFKMLKDINTDNILEGFQGTLGMRGYSSYACCVPIT